MSVLIVSKEKIFKFWFHNTTFFDDCFIYNDFIIQSFIFSMNILFFKKFGGNSEKETYYNFLLWNLSTKWIGAIKTSILYLRIPCYNRNTFSVNLTWKNNSDFYHWNYINPYWACGLTKKKLRQQTRLDV